jgi:Protein of unknown function (DUF1566)
MIDRIFLQRFYVTALMLGVASCGGRDPANNPADPPIDMVGSRLNDTGLVLCAGQDQGQLPCPQMGLPQQDGEVGRDVQARTGGLVKMGAGEAGFDWTKLDNAGQPLTNQDGAWSATGTEQEGTRWSCVQDHVTGLTWEVKESDPEHPRYGGHSYRWWLDDVRLNGGFVDQSTSGSCSLDSCDTQSYVNWVNQARLCGYADWRMPDVVELSSIVVLSKVIPAVDKNFFPNTLQPRFFTSRSLARDPSRAWYVYFSDGSVSSTNKGDASHVRLVRGGEL